MAVSTPVCDFDAPIVDFALPDPDGHLWRLEDIRGPNGTLVMFICNHCPYVQAVMDRITRDAAELRRDHGIGVVAISANDTETYPQDAPQFMKVEAERHGFDFPYLHDATQEIARAYGAECTPDFFGYNADGKLQYRGRLDASGRQAGPADARRELFEAMVLIAQTGEGPRDQVASMGCSIKWKD
ncbi:thioredoxin family protein [Paracoccus xiamenensis]|uniref:thioredoxin family protein n=1 Tax=Paracoccus xiamenensis TaxID=2714901 RepID=UPI001408B278|nr:thioredoxin family protein [Paracoccus xiamenensis]NHF72480.1 thioredoxin family protein [Paracoccus xiamenensis]